MALAVLIFVIVVFPVLFFALQPARVSSEVPDVSEEEAMVIREDQQVYLITNTVEFNNGLVRRNDTA